MTLTLCIPNCIRKFSYSKSIVIFKVFGIDFGMQILLFYRFRSEGMKVYYLTDFINRWHLAAKVWAAINGRILLRSVFETNSKVMRKGSEQGTYRSYV